MSWISARRSQRMQRLVRSRAAQKRTPQTPTGRWLRHVWAIVAICSAVLVWWALSFTGALSGTVPSPRSVLTGAVALAERGVLWDSVTATAGRVLVGFAVGSAAGIGLARLARGSTIVFLARPAATILRATPLVAWLPALAIAVSDLDVVGWMAGALVAASAVFSEFVTPPGAARNGLPPTLRPALAQCWAVVVAGELFRVSSGLGSLQVLARHDGDAATVYAVLILLGALAAAGDAALRWAEGWWAGRCALPRSHGLRVRGGGGR